MRSGLRFVVSAVLTLSLGFAVSIQAFADLSVPSLFADNMVVQQGMKVPVWGKAKPGENIVVEFAGQSVAEKADKNGAWKVTLRATNKPGPYEMSVKGEDTSLRFTNVLVGEVWVCSGQSNMQWTVSRSKDSEAEIAAANYPNIHLFQVPMVTADTPQEKCGGQWVICSPETIKEFTAVGYFFGRALHKELDTPIGLIQSAWGGTAAEAWTSLPTLQANAELKPILEHWDQIVADYPKVKAAYDQQIAEWQKAADQAKTAGQPEPKKPSAPTAPDNPNRPANLYNAMINPVAPYAIQGAIWYQGESNAGRAYQYRLLFPTMINDWRRAWGNRPFPFYFVQLANFLDRQPEPGESAWAELREAQSMTLALKNTGQAVIIDIGDAKDIHPTNKQDVGKRLALNALAKTYKHDIEYSGPTYKNMRVRGNEAALVFDHAKSGLAVQGGGELKGFAVAGADKKFVWAKAQIQGNKIVVSAVDVEKPVAVRYAWADNPECNLVNGAGLPASPFRTDSWPGKTIDSK